ncbi:MAG: hypothetical protein QM660_09075 [Dysgonomonas sp.]
MKKEIIVNNLVFNFEYVDEKSMWNLGYHEFDFLKIGYDVNITINKGEPSWDEIIFFLKFILDDISGFKRLLVQSNSKLRNYFYNMYKDVEIDIEISNIFFTLCNIEYIKYSSKVQQFEYVLNFNIESVSDPDFFMYDTWNAYYMNNQLIDISRS